MGQMAATSSLGVSFCGDRVLNTAAVPPRKSIEATSESWASMSSAPSFWRRLPRVATPTTGSVAIDSRGSVAAVLIRGSIRGDMAARYWPWELAMREVGRSRVGQCRPTKLCRLFRLIRGIQLHNREKISRHKRKLRQFQPLAVLAFVT